MALSISCAGQNRQTLRCGFDDSGEGSYQEEHQDVADDLVDIKISAHGDVPSPAEKVWSCDGTQIHLLIMGVTQPDDRQKVVKAEPKPNATTRPLVSLVFSRNPENEPAEQNDESRRIKHSKGVEADAITDAVLKAAQLQVHPTLSALAFAILTGE